jgi:hypothetical protein
MGFIKFMGWSFAAIIVLAVFVGATGGGRSGSSEPAAGTVEMNDDHKRTLTAQIQLRGFVCPKVKIATAIGPEPRGHAIRAYCGPADKDGVFQNLKYKAIVRPDDSLIVEPWK